MTAETPRKGRLWVAPTLTRPPDRYGHHKEIIMNTAIENILANIGHETLDALEEASHAARRNTIAAGGIGQTREEMDRAEELLATVAAERASILAQVDEDLEEAKGELQENGINPDGMSIAEILGDDYPALPYI